MSPVHNDIFSDSKPSGYRRLRQVDWGVYVSAPHSFRSTKYLFDLSGLTVLRYRCCCIECIRCEYLVELLLLAKSTGVERIYLHGATGGQGWERSDELKQVQSGVALVEFHEIFGRFPMRFRRFEPDYMPEGEIVFGGEVEAIIWYLSYTNILFSDKSGSDWQLTYRLVVNWLLKLEELKPGFSGIQFLSRLRDDEESKQVTRYGPERSDLVQRLLNEMTA